jgi:hypothetical protein
MKKIIALLFSVNSFVCYAQDSKSCLLVATYLIDNGSDDLLCQSVGYLKEFVADENQAKVAERKAWDKAPGLITGVNFINATSAVLIYQYDLINGPGCKPTKINLEKATSLDECMKYYSSSVERLKKENASNFKIIFQWEGKNKNRVFTLLQISDLDIEVTEVKNVNGIMACKMKFKNNNKIKGARFYYQDEFGKEHNIVIPPGSDNTMLSGKFKSGNLMKASFEDYEEMEPFDLIQHVKEKVYKFITSDYLRVEEVNQKEKPSKQPAVHGIRG